jgi:hypothetical protein
MIDYPGPEYVVLSEEKEWLKGSSKRAPIEHQHHFSAYHYSEIIMPSFTVSLLRIEFNSLHVALGCFNISISSPVWVDRGHSVTVAARQRGRENRPL